ncbi:MAG: DUF6531 domain-containing protein [Pseudomonadota bacterium]
MKDKKLFVIFIILLTFICSFTLASAIVNKKTLNYIEQFEDFSIPCYSNPLEVFRTFSSFIGYNGPFGKSWTFNYDVRLYERGDSIEILEMDGRTNEFVPFGEGEKYRKNSAKKIMLLRKKELEGKSIKKSTNYYKELYTKLVKDDELYKEMKAKYIKSSAQTKAGKYESYDRGYAVLQKLDNGSYVRILQNGRKDYFNKDGLIVKVVDRNGNAITMQHINGQLKYVSDSCGRKMRLDYNKRGKISKITDPFNRKFQYTYDKKDRMIGYKDSDGKVTRYNYEDRTNNIVEITYPDGKKLKNYYNKKGWIGKQIDTTGSVTTYERKEDKNNKFHHWVKTSYYNGTWRKYDFYKDQYKIVETTNDGTNRTVMNTPCCNKPMSITNEKGQAEYFEYDKENNLIRKTNSSGDVIEFTYEKKFNQMKSITQSDGTVTALEYDKLGNIIQSKTNKGKKITMKYNNRGKPAYISDNTGNEISFTYNYFGKPTQMTKKDCGEATITYDKFGRRISYQGKAYKNSKFKDNQVMLEIQNTILGLLQGLTPPGVGPTI